MSSLRNLRFLVQRELGVYFVSPTAYIILTVMMLIFGLMFWNEMERCHNYAVPFYFSNLMGTMSFVIVVTSPLITMRLLAEEKNRGTIELLMTSPVREWEVVVAKYLASVAFLAFLLLPTLVHAGLAAKYGTMDWGTLAAQYLGLLLLGSSVFAIGLFISSVCQSQVTAGVITFSISFLLILSALLSDNIPTTEKWMRISKDVIAQLDPFKYFPDFMRGIVDVRPVVYYLSLVVLFNFLSVRALESRRWR